jgi:hypothetical protein
MKMIKVMIWFPGADTNSPTESPFAPYPLTISGFKAVPKARDFIAHFHISSPAAWPVPVVQIPHCSHMARQWGVMSGRTVKPPLELVLYAHQTPLPPECTTVLAVPLKKDDGAKFKGLKLCLFLIYHHAVKKYLSWHINKVLFSVYIMQMRPEGKRPLGRTRH